jgi:hypothetical protein
MRVHALVLCSLLAAAPAGAQEHSVRDDSPVVRASRGDIGMFFKFAGLATLGVDNPAPDVAGFIYHQVGLKFALTRRWMLPVFFGVGVNVHSGDNATLGKDVDWGLMLGTGFEYHFRIWRRISPFVGATIGFEFNDPRGSGNFRFATALGPQLGVEFFWADRSSLTAYYEMQLRVVRLQDAYTDVSLRTAAGGGLILTFYF